MCFKAILFVVVGVTSALVLLQQSPNFLTAVLLATCIWAFARTYYFAFYVVERYIDESYRFSGLLSAVLFVYRTVLARGARPHQ